MFQHLICRLTSEQSVPLSPTCRQTLCRLCVHFSYVNVCFGFTHQGSRLNNTNSIWEKETLHNNDSELIKDLRSDQANLPKQGPVDFTMADSQQRLSGMKNMTTPDPDTICTYWLKKLNSLPDDLAS